MNDTDFCYTSIDRYRSLALIDAFNEICSARGDEHIDC